LEFALQPTMALRNGLGLSGQFPAKKSMSKASQ
jgi:hypothetical protein